MNSTKRSVNAEEKLYVATQWQLIARKFRKHKLANAGLILLILLYLMAAFCEFFSVQDIAKRNTDYLFVPPQKIHFIDSEGRFSLQPFVYGLKMESDPVTWRKIYAEDTSKKTTYLSFYKRRSLQIVGFD